MVTTQSSSSPPPNDKVMLEHVVTVILKQAKDGPIAKALAAAALEEINNVLLLNQPSRESLTYQLADGTEKTLPIGYRNLLRALKIYADYCQAEGDPVDDWTSITKKDFDDFRCIQVCMAATERIDTLFSLAMTSAPKQKDLLAEFKKGIKRDASLFVVLKDPKQWDSWHWSTLAQAQAQDVSNVLNLMFWPATGEQDLFNAKQRYMYAVFERVLQTDKGKALVRSNEATSNTQKIFVELCQDALRSTRASIDSSRLLSYITLVRIGDGLWNGTSHSFILHWQEQV